MYEELYQYLISYKQVAIPGVGNFLLDRKSAENDFFNKKINPPSYAISFHAGDIPPAANFLNWLSDLLNVSKEKAADTFNDFSTEMKSKINNGSTVNWNGVGILSKGLGGEIKFKPSVAALTLEKSIAAEKVIRLKAEHMVRVGEDQKTSTEMTEMLKQEEAKKSYWWAAALIVGLLGLVFIGWYFSEHGIETASVANTKTVVPMEAASTYQIVP